MHSDFGKTYEEIKKKIFRKIPAAPTDVHVLFQESRPF